MNYGAMGQLLGSRVTPSEGNLMKKVSRKIPENGRKFFIHIRVKGNLMKKRPGDIPENDSNDTVIVFESDFDTSNMSYEEILEKMKEDTCTHLNKVLTGKITERNYKPPPMTIERMIADETHRETMHLDRGAVDKIYKEIESVDNTIQQYTDTRTLLLDERDQNEKGELLEIVKIINSKIKRIEDEINRHKKNREELVERHDEAKKNYYREFNAASQRATKTVDETMPWEMGVEEMKPGPKVKLSDSDYTMRDIGIIIGYEEELAKDPGPSGRGQKKRVIQTMAKKLRAAGKRRTGPVKIRKILSARGIK